MAQIFSTTGAQVLRPDENIPIRVVEYANPEVILPTMIQEYLLEVGFSNLYPNFKHINIGAVHPFAVLLLQTVNGTQLDLSVFPSITISDSSDSEVHSELGRGFENAMYTPSDLAQLLGQVTAGNLIMSDENVVRVQAEIDAGTSIMYTKTAYKAQHSVDMNIWTENKDLTSMVYDLLKHFIMGNIAELHSYGYDMNNPISGRRSGDINVEFGRLLYGANITMSVTIDTASMVLDLPFGEIATITPDPTFYVEGGV